MVDYNPYKHWVVSAFFIAPLAFAMCGSNRPGLHVVVESPCPAAGGKAPPPRPAA